ncbi:MAG: hypothetical protein WKF78_05745 [Candidatus Limnocylindrales bacterium]
MSLSHDLRSHLRRARRRYIVLFVLVALVVSVIPADLATLRAAEPKVRPFMAEDDGTPAGPRAVTSAGVAAAVGDATFQDTVAISGLTFPTALRFAPTGGVFVAEKSGLIKVFDSLTRPDAHRLRGPAQQRRRLLGPRVAWPGAGPAVPDRSVRLRPVHVRRAHRW